MSMPKLNDNFHTKIFSPDMKGDFEVYVAFKETSEEKKKQIIRELDQFAEKIEKVLRE